MIRGPVVDAILTLNVSYSLTSFSISRDHPTTIKPASLGSELSLKSMDGPTLSFIENIIIYILDAFKVVRSIKTDRAANKP